MKTRVVIFITLTTLLSTVTPLRLIKSIFNTVDEKTSAVAETVVDVGGAVLDAGSVVVSNVSDKVADTIRPDDVCYDVLECFSMDSPWFTLLRPLPAPYAPKDISVRFYLYTRNPSTRFNLSLTDTTFDATGSDFVGLRQTYFITHGFSSNGNSSWLSDMKDAILKKYDANVILVDWGKGASLLNYFQVAANTRVVGATLAKLANYLINQWGADPSRFHVIGHSLGAQVSSYMAKRVPNIARFYALDPAQPAFEGYDHQVRLDKTDAKFVQVIHTTARPFIPFIGLGMIQPHGHVDFYLNGGWNQPGCILPPKPNITSFLQLATIPVEVISNFISCPHGRSYEFLTATILHGETCIFWGHSASPTQILASVVSAGHLAKHVIPDTECDQDTCSPLGFAAHEYPARGTFDVATTSRKPFCVQEPTVDKNMRKFRALTANNESTKYSNDSVDSNSTEDESNSDDQLASHLVTSPRPERKVNI